MHCFYHPNIDRQQIKLDQKESHHLARVLRFNNGDRVWVTNGKGKRYHATVLKVDPNDSRLSVGEVALEEKPKPAFEIAIAPPKKPQRFEYFIEKAVEMGVHKISPLICKRSEKTRWKMDRLKKIAVSAMKQSLRAWLPGIAHPVDFGQYLEDMRYSDARKFIAQHREEHPMLSDSLLPGSHYIVLIGPEGDFTEEEYTAAARAGFIGVNLSDFRLRTETAALVALSQMKMGSKKKGG